jgi:hypothetical protein
MPNRVTMNLASTEIEKSRCLKTKIFSDRIGKVAPFEIKNPLILNMKSRTFLNQKAAEIEKEKPRCLNMKSRVV